MADEEKKKTEDKFGIPKSATTFQSGTGKIEEPEMVKEPVKEKAAAPPIAKEQKEQTRMSKADWTADKVKEFCEPFVLPVLSVIIFLVLVLAIFSDAITGTEADFYGNRITNRGGQIRSTEWFSIEVAEMNGRNAEEWGIRSQIEGVIVTDVEGTQDVKMKLHEGDVICSMDGASIESIGDFNKATKAFDQKVGFFMDINRYGYPMYVSVSNPDFQNGVLQTLGPPPIPRDANMPHDYRGVCSLCHQIIAGRTGPGAQGFGAQVGRNNAAYPRGQYPPGVQPTGSIYRQANGICQHGYRGRCPVCNFNAARRQ